MRPLPVDTNQRVLLHLQQGLSDRQVAKLCKVSRPTIRRIREKNFPNLSKSRGGRPPALSPQDKRFCVRAITSGKLETATAVVKELQEELKIEISDRTIRRTLQEAGLEAVGKRNRPKLSAKNIKARLEFARRHKHWTVEDWKRVIWFDETKINRSCSGGRSWCWKGDRESCKPHHVKQTVKHGGGSVMIWGCMTAEGPGFMYRVLKIWTSICTSRYSKMTC